MKRIRVIYFITSYRKSGPIRQTLNIIKSIDIEKFEPIMVSLFNENEDDTLINEFKKLDIEMYCLKFNRVKSVIFGKRRVIKLFNKIQADLVHSVGMPLYTLAINYKRAKHLITIRNYCYEDYPDKYGKLIGNILAIKDMRLIKKQYENGEKFITCSESLSNIYRKKHNLKFEVIRNGVDLLEYPTTSIEIRRERRRQLGLEQNKTVLIYTGQFIERKDQDFAIKGFLESEVKESCVLLLLGEGQKYNELYNKYKDNSSISFTGNVTNVPDYLQASDIYISTSKSEGLPNGVLEAMSIGLPVLLSDILQHKELMEVGIDFGQIYKLGDINDFVRKLNSICGSDLLELGKNSYYAVSRNLTSNLMSQNYQCLYMDLVS